MSTYNEVRLIKKQGITLKYAVLSIAAVGVIGAVFMAGGREGYGYGYHKAIATVRTAVQASQYPTVKVVWASKKPVAIISGGICQPVDSARELPSFYHVEYVSPYDRPCGPGKPGTPYADSAALSAIKAQVDATH
jgi:hypothetical protein